MCLIIIFLYCCTVGDAFVCLQEVCWLTPPTVSRRRCMIDQRLHTSTSAPGHSPLIPPTLIRSCTSFWRSSSTLWYEQDLISYCRRTLTHGYTPLGIFRGAVSVLPQRAGLSSHTQRPQQWRTSLTRRWVSPSANCLVIVCDSLSFSLQLLLSWS